MRQLALDIFGLVGLAAFLHGLWLVHRPATWMVGGLLALALSVLLTRSARRAP